MKRGEGETEPLTEKCNECGKAITDTEWVDNWCSCSECFNKHLDEYDWGKMQL